MKNNYPILYSSLLLLCLASCTQSDLLPGEESREGERHEIVLSGGFGNIEGEVVPGTRGMTDGNSTITTFYLSRIERNTASTAWPEYNASSSSLSVSRAAGTGYQPLTFNVTQYYPMEKLYGNSGNSYNLVRFVGWHPQASSTSTKTVYIDHDGVNDILLSNQVEGSYTDQFTASQNRLTFKHLLCRITVQVVASSETPEAR